MIGIKLGMNLGSNVPTLIQQALSAIRRLGGTALYVPDDYRGAFVDSTGTQPVTAINDLVGLLTDRSYGAGNLGGELVPATSYTGVAAGAWTISSNSLARNGEAVFSVKLNLSTAMATSKRYRVSFTVSGFSGDSTNISLGDGGAAIGLITGNGEYVLPAVSAGGTSSTIVFFPWAGTAGQAVISNISVREVLGNHATQGTTAAKPLVTQLANGTKALDFDGSNDLLTIPVNTGTSGTFIVACIPQQNVWRQCMASGAQIPTVPGVRIGFNGSGQPAGTVADGTNGFVATSPTVAPLGVPLVMSFKWSSGSQSLYVNGALVATASGSVAASAGGVIAIGAQQTLSDYFDGPLIDCVYAPSALNDSDRRTIERNMAQRAGVTYVG